jgi:hypothetical protein
MRALPTLKLPQENPELAVLVLWGPVSLAQVSAPFLVLLASPVTPSFQVKS